MSEAVLNSTSQVVQIAIETNPDELSIHLGEWANLLFSFLPPSHLAEYLLPTLVQFIIDHHTGIGAIEPRITKCLQLLSHVIHSNGVLDSTIRKLDPFPGMIPDPFMLSLVDLICFLLVMLFNIFFVIIAHFQSCRSLVILTVATIPFVALCRWIVKWKGSSRHRKLDPM
jgi:hypothetical protein